MHITTGTFKGKPLLTPTKGIRPTSERVRQALMNSLGPRLSGARFLDLFCGTGSVGIEALSQGAAFVCFVEKAERNYIFLKQNLANLGVDKSLYKTIKTNIFTMKPEQFEGMFDIVFADPFYEDIKDGFAIIHHLVWHILVPEGLFVCEHGAKDDLSSFPGYRETKSYGDSQLSFFERKS
ncbi:MAG: RsmD family RNA methyltransferase [Brevinematales bacterium]|nr:RsmD family RNA methyltransferase [Brevinematales bacterium]